MKEQTWRRNSRHTVGQQLKEDGGERPIGLCDERGLGLVDRYSEQHTSCLSSRGSPSKRRREEIDHFFLTFEPSRRHPCRRGGGERRGEEGESQRGLRRDSGLSIVVVCRRRPMPKIAGGCHPWAGDWPERRAGRIRRGARFSGSFLGYGPSIIRGLASYIINNS